MAQFIMQQAFHLALQHHQAGRLHEAEELYRQVLAHCPEHAEALHNLGVLAHQSGRYDVAIDLLRRCIAIKPNVAEAYTNLGNSLKDRGDWDEAIAACRKAIALKPNLAEGHNNLGHALQCKGLADQALAAYRQAIVLKPDFPDTHNNLGNVLKDTGLLDDAMAAYRMAIMLKPNYPEAHSNLVLSLHYHPGITGAAIAQESRRWNQQHAEPLSRHIPVHANDRNPHRRLRIGYVSADFKTHASAYFLVPLLENHDPRQVELFCYAQVPRSDALTQRFRQRADHWCDTVGLSDQQVAGQIRDDQIDILVDLKLHLRENRLLVFARKPAPVQVTWLGYPGSTGLTAIDYRLSDPYLDPPGMDESIYSEQTIRLPDSFWCYDPLDGRDIPVNSLPALDRGVVTFGNLNNFNKFNPETFTLWSQVLRKVANSRLLLLATEGEHRQRTVEWLQEQGIAPNRVEFVPPKSHGRYMELYHGIDLGLDSFPCNGHTTSLDSLWMGVPVVTLAGQTAVGRAGWSHLSNLGLTELAGQTPEQFVQIAVNLANDLPRLQHLRATLRPRMEASPLMDARRFAGNIEAAYRQMWRHYCAAAVAG